MELDKISIVHLPMGVPTLSNTFLSHKYETETANRIFGEFISIYWGVNAHHTLNLASTLRLWISE